MPAGNHCHKAERQEEEEQHLRYAHGGSEAKEGSQERANEEHDGPVQHFGIPLRIGPVIEVGAYVGVDPFLRLGPHLFRGLLIKIFDQSFDEIAQGFIVPEDPVLLHVVGRRTQRNIHRVVYLVGGNVVSPVNDRGCPTKASGLQ